jgi:deoxyribodipyrimidine photo-lyase
VAEGGEAAARKRANTWIRDHLHDYEAGSDDLAGDRTSRLSPYIHFGCISPRELVELAGRDCEAFVRQLAWKAGETGVPLVDAGMKQLLHEGWMHNRARLVTGSYLTKTLGIDWREGARHFYELLVDGDVANNAGNWQWVAGTGADTRPNRRLNPQRQAKRFDPEGAYIQRWLGETDRLF